jgi:hypothetical protein
VGRGAARALAGGGRPASRYTSLLRDEPVAPIVQRLLADFYGYLRAIHALGFPTWRSLTREQGLGDAEAVALMGGLVNGTGR